MTEHALWLSPWPAEDGGPQRLGQFRQHSSPALDLTAPLSVTAREVAVATMVVLRDPGEVFLLRHSGPPDATSFVEQIDPESLEAIARSENLAGGPVWPGGIAAHSNGSLYVIFGNHVHKLSAALKTECSLALPRQRPYNSFVVLADGTIITKDFAGPYAGHDPNDSRPAQILAIDPTDLSVIASFDLAEASVARLSSLDSEVVVVGTESVFSISFDGQTFREQSRTPYRTQTGQGCGWDAVLDGDVMFFLDNGDGTDRFDGSFEGRGIATVPLRLHRVNRRTGEARSVEVSGLLNGIIANPPALDTTRRIVVAFDSGNGIVAGIHADTLEILWKKNLNHAAHALHDDNAGLIVLSDFDRTTGVDHAVIIETATGREVQRIPTESLLQSALFPSAGFNQDLYLASFTTLTRITQAL
jgi:hypothetical protein